MEQLLAHLFGDYVLQNDWMAQRKTKSSIPAGVHAATYTLPFILLTQSPWALAVIGVTHFVIDRFSLAKYIVWGKNQLPRTEFSYSREEMSGFGFNQNAPLWLQFPIYVVTDNAMHLAINYSAITWL